MNAGYPHTEADYVADALEALGDLLDAVERLQYLGLGPDGPTAIALASGLYAAVDEVLPPTHEAREAYLDRIDGIVACAPGSVR